MCSWCWGFRPVWNRVVAQLNESIRVRYVLGGLAADTDVPMPVEMQARIQNTWRHIQQEIPGTVFNFDFWEKCAPRRSTYPSCRAIIAARNQIRDADTRMLPAIQQAYYLHAKNPSDNDVLIGLADALGLNTVLFRADLDTDQTQDRLLQEFRLRDQLGVCSFPGLVLAVDGSLKSIHIDYTHPDVILKQIDDCTSNAAG